MMAEERVTPYSLSTVQGSYAIGYNDMTRTERGNGGFLFLFD
jgi:hypothetical protein